MSKQHFGIGQRKLILQADWPYNRGTFLLCPIMRLMVQLIKLSRGSNPLNRQGLKFWFQSLIAMIWLIYNEACKIQLQILFPLPQMMPFPCKIWPRYFKIDHTSGVFWPWGGLFHSQNANFVRDQPQIDHISGLTLHPWTIQASRLYSL